MNILGYLQEQNKEETPEVCQSAIGWTHLVNVSASATGTKKQDTIDGALVDAQIGRRILDRLVGYQVTPLLHKKFAFGLSAGRVQSCALYFIVKRERERRAFEPRQYWVPEVLLDCGITARG